MTYCCHTSHLAKDTLNAFAVISFVELHSLIVSVVFVQGLFGHFAVGTVRLGEHHHALVVENDLHQLALWRVQRDIVWHWGQPITHAAVNTSRNPTGQKGEGKKVECQPFLDHNKNESLR